MFELTHSNGIHIPHLSPSTINSFITNRFSFYQSKVMRKPFAGNQYTSRGTAVEHSINQWLETGESDLEVLQKIALAKFDEEIEKAKLSKIAVEDERDTIPGLVELAFGFYSQEFAENKALTQQKFCIGVEGLQREVLGYTDYFQRGLVVRDSKVVSKTPSSLSQNYILQGSFYRKATGLPVVFDFFIPNKKPVHKAITLSDDEYIFGWSYLVAAAKAMEELEACDNPKRVMELMSFPDISSFYNHTERKEAAEIWGIKL